MVQNPFLKREGSQYFAVSIVLFNQCDNVLTYNIIKNS